MINAIRVVDDIFLRLAEAGGGLPIDDAVEAMWTALESGALRLVVAGQRLRVEPVDGPPAKRLLDRSTGRRPSGCWWPADVASLRQSRK